MNKNLKVFLIAIFFTVAELFIISGVAFFLVLEFEFENSLVLFSHSRGWGYLFSIFLIFFGILLRVTTEFSFKKVK